MNKNSKNIYIYQKKISSILDTTRSFINYTDTSAAKTKKRQTAHQNMYDTSREIIEIFHDF